MILREIDNKQRFQSRFSVALVVIISIILTACVDNLVPEASSLQGELSVVVEPNYNFNVSSSVESSSVASGQTKAVAGADDVPSADDFNIVIENQAKRVLYSREGSVWRKPNSDMNPLNGNGNLPFDVGTYVATATYGDPNSVGIGKEYSYYHISSDFEIIPHKSTQVTLQPLMKKVKVKVEFGRFIKHIYGNDLHVIVVDADDSGKQIKFSTLDTQDGYMPAGKHYILVFIPKDGKYVYHKFDAREFNANDYAVYNVDIPTPMGDLKVDVTLDQTTTEIPVVGTVPLYMVPKPAPSIEIFKNDSSVGSSLSMSFDEGANFKGNINQNEYKSTDLRIKVDAQYPVESCVMKVACPALGVGTDDSPITIELNNPSDISKEYLTKLGITSGAFAENIPIDDSESNPARYTEINLKGLVDKIEDCSVYYDGDDKKESTSVAFEVTDIHGQKSTTSKIDINMNPGVFYWNDLPSPAAWQIWATKITDIPFTFSSGERALLKVQYRTTPDGEWSDCSTENISGSSNLAHIRGLKGNVSGEKYSYIERRLIYNDNEMTADYKTFTNEIQLEKMLQLGNNKFDEWSTESYQYTAKTLFVTRTQYRNWYLPYYSNSSDKWWAVNSKKTMPNKTTTEYDNYKVVPTVTYNSDSYQGKFAKLMTIAVGSLGSEIAVGDTKVAGEIWLGTANDDGSISVDGRRFESRPSSMDYKYQLTTCNSNSYQVYVEVYNGSTLIGSGETGGNKNTNGWTDGKVTIDYNKINGEYGVATMIKVHFKSSTSTDVVGAGNAVNVLFGDQENRKTYVGNILCIDDLKLIYE